ncbi:MAG TPA: hypothetical protein VI959_00235 [Alphaproteobacteria bacterium]|nr:hypothetical protein [Alphaproteobacteria bacterium]
MEKKWKERVKLLKKTIKQRDDGEVEVSWKDSYTVWGRVIPTKPKAVLKEEGWGEEAFKRVSPNDWVYKLLLKCTSVQFDGVLWRDQIFVLLGRPFTDEDQLVMQCWIKLKKGEKLWEQQITV